MKTKLLNHFIFTFAMLLVAIVFHGNSYGQIALRGTATTATTTSTTLTINKPTGLAIDDVMILQIVQSGNGNAITDVAQTGWTQIAGSDIRATTNNRSRATLYYKVATSTDVAASNFSFTLHSESDDGEGGILAFSGVDATVFDVTPGTAYTNIASDNTLTATAISTTSANSAILMFGAVSNNENLSSWTTSDPGSLTELYDVPFNCTIDLGMGAAWSMKSATGSTGTGTAAITASDYNGAILIALKSIPPKEYYIRTGGTYNANLQNTASWTDDPIGVGGTSPANFTTANQIFNIGDNGITSASLGGNWTVSGTYSKIILGHSTACNFTVGSNFVLTAQTDITSEGTLTLSTSGALTGINLSTLETGSTVDYALSGAQTCLVRTYSNLTLSGSGVKTFSTTPTVNGVLSMEGAATVTVTTGVITYGGTATLQYNTATARTSSSEEWITPFAATGGVVIANTGAITMNVAKVFNASVPLTINSGATLATNNLQLTLGGDFVNNGGTFTAGSTPIIIGPGTVNQNIAGFTTTGTVSMTKTGGIATFTGNVNGAGLTINGSGGTLNLGTGLTHTFTGTWTRTAGTLNGGSSTLRLGSGFSGTAGTFTAGAGTVEWYASGTQTCAAVIYNDLTLAGSGAKTLTSVSTINGDFTLSGSATATPTTTLTVAGITTLSNTSILTLGAANILSNTGAITLNGGTFRTGSTTGNSETVGVLTMNTSSTIALGTGIHTLTISNSSAASWTGTLSITGWISGTNHIQVGVGGLSDTQLDQISFSGYSSGANISASGELFPKNPWQAKFISMNAGSSSWCPGELRTVTVTVKNVGTSAWSSAGNGINIGLKWDEDTDYGAGPNNIPRQSSEAGSPSGPVAPGTTVTYTFPNVPGSMVLGTNHLTFDVVNELVCWFGDNNGTCGPGNSVFTSTALTILTPPAAPTGSASQSFCSSINPTVADLTATGTAIQWYAASSGGSPLPASTSLSNGTHYYASQTTTCESTSRLDVTVTIIAAPTTTGVTICAGGSGSLTSSTSCSSTNGSEGPKNTGTGANVTGIGTIAWTNPGNITTTGSPYATSSVPGGSITNYLRATNFGFNIPTNATINGIQVVINRTGTQPVAGYGIFDNSLYLVKNVSGSPVIQTSGNNKASTGTIWPTSLGTATYGATNDVWGITWTATDINNLNFGAALSVTANGASNKTATVDYIQITVTYTIPGSLDWYTASSGGTLIGSGSPFNPVGVSGSGLPNTNTPGTTTFYAECNANTGCRTATDFVINPRPIAAITSSNTSICDGGSTSISGTITASGAWTLTLDNSGGTVTGTGSGTWSKSVSPTSTTTYAISSLVDAQCTSIAADLTGSEQVTVYARPLAAITSSNTSICDGGSTSISGTITASGAWTLTLDNGGGSVTGTGSGTWSKSVSPTSTTTYAISSLVDAQCTSIAADLTGSEQVTVNARPVAAITSINTSICDGGSTSISGTITASGAWTLTLDNSGGTVTGTGSGTWSKSVSPTSTTTYAISSLVDAQCTSIAADLTGSEQVTVNARPVAAITSSNTSICDGGSTSISGTITASGAWTLTLDNSGGTVTGTGSGTWSKSVSPTSTTTYAISSLVDAQCTSIAADLTGSEQVTVNAQPTVTFITQPGVSACVGIDVTYKTQALMTSYVWVFPGVLNTDYSITSGGTSTDSTVTLKYLTSGSKTVTINYTNSNGCTAATATSSIATTINVGIWLGTTSTDWNTVSNWCGGVPTASTDVTIPAGVTNMPHITSGLTSPAECNNLTIENGDSLTVDAGKALTINGNLIVNGISALIVKASSTANGSLITKGNITYLNSGSIKIEKYVSSGTVSHWEYLSSPVTTASSSIFTAPSRGLWWSNETINAWASISNASPANMSILKGYGRNYLTSEGDGNVIKNFIGSVNTGSQSISLTRTESAPGGKHGWNLVGNPYPDAIDWNSANGWTKTNLCNAIYFRNDGTTSSYVDGVTTGVVPASGIIPPMTAFWVRVDSLHSIGTLACDNNVRIHNTTMPTVTHKNTLHISVVNISNSLLDDAYVRFKDYATDGFDGQYDAYKFYSTDTPRPQIYTRITGADDIAINTMDTLNGSRVVPLGFKTNVSGNFTITADLVSSLTSYGNYIYLKDNETNTVQNLSADNTYDFYSAVTNNLSRFVVLFNPTNTVFPTITLVSNSLAVSAGTTNANLSFTGTTNNPDQYSIDFNAAANSAGFIDVTYDSLPTSPITISIPSSVSPGIYQASLKVRISSTGAESISYSISIQIKNVFSVTQDIGTTLLASWSAVTGAGIYGFQYRPYGSSVAWMGIGANVNYVKVANLIPGSHYEYRIKAYYSSGASIPGMETGDFWTQSFTYTKDKDMGTVLRINWPDCSPWASSYAFQYKMKYGGTSWLGSSVYSPNFKMSTIPDTAYVCQVVVYKGGTLWGIAKVGEFKADSYTSYVTNNTGTSLDLTWSDLNTSDPASWVIDQYLRYRIKNSTNAWTQKYVSGGNNTTHLTGLTTNTEYEFQVYVYLPSYWGTTTLGFFSTNIVKKISADNSNININIYPNPFVDEVKMDIFTENETNINWKIFDLTGKLISNGNESISSGYSTLRIDAAKLTPGLYMINAIINDQVRTFRMLKQ